MISSLLQHNNPKPGKERFETITENSKEILLFRTYFPDVIC